MVIAVALFTWYKILFRFPTGEGFFYFDPLNTLNLKEITVPFVLKNYGFLAKLIFTILIPIFKDNVHYYMYFQFLVMVGVYLTFYYVILKIFKDKILAVLSTIFFIADYVGSFTMMGQGDYQRFIQRVPNIIPTLLAFMFLVLYLRTKKTKFFNLSFFVYILSMLLSHYTTFLLPLFVLLPPFTWLIERKISFKKAIFIPIVFGVTTILLTRTDSLSRPSYSILSFATKTPRLVEMVLYQIPMTGFPIQFIQFMGTHSSMTVIDSYIRLLFATLIIVLICLYLGFLKIKDNRENLSIYLTLIASLFIVSFLLMYAYNIIPNPIINFGEDRIYFIHSIIFAIIWAMLVKAFFGLKNKKLYMKMAIVIGLMYLFQNIPVIWRGMNDIEIHSQIVGNYIKTIKGLSQEFNKNSVIVETPELITVSAFVERFYHISNTNFISFDNDWKLRLEKMGAKKNDVFIFELKPGSSEIINLTQDFRSGKKI